MGLFVQLASRTERGIMKICVFGSSSKFSPQPYLDESFELGKLIAEAGHICVNGGGKYGVMGYVTAGARSKEGKVIGIIHENFCVDGEEASHTTELIKSKGPDLTERKQLLYDNGDCIIVLPGGVGTFDEFWESVSAKSLNMKGLGKKPICVINVNGFYDGFIMQLEKAFNDGLLYNNTSDFFYVATSASEALQWCISTHNQLSSGTFSHDLSTSRKSMKGVPIVSYASQAKGETIRPQKELESTSAKKDDPIKLSEVADVKSQYLPSHTASVALGVMFGIVITRIFFSK